MDFIPSLALLVSHDTNELVQDLNADDPPVHHERFGFDGLGSIGKRVDENVGVQERLSVHWLPGDRIYTRVGEGGAGNASSPALPRASACARPQDFAFQRL